jgi:hypothetical protein
MIESLVISRADADIAVSERRRFRRTQVRERKEQVPLVGHSNREYTAGPGFISLFDVVANLAKSLTPKQFPL